MGNSGRLDFLQPVVELRIRILDFVFNSDELYNTSIITTYEMIDQDKDSKNQKIHKYWLEDILKVIADRKEVGDLSVLFSDDVCK